MSLSTSVALKGLSGTCHESAAISCPARVNRCFDIANVNFSNLRLLRFTVRQEPSVHKSPSGGRITLALKKKKKSSHLPSVIHSYFKTVNKQKKKRWIKKPVVKITLQFCCEISYKN